ncbi:MAG: PTS sugar transporter subunit IIA [Vicinamibacteria bacterium]
MIGILVVTHGRLASELVTAAEMIVGEIPNVTAVSIGWHDDPDEAQEEIRNAIERVEGDQGTVVLTDMFGGTPSNLSLAFLEKDRVEVITGVNLPMLIKLVSLREGEQVDLGAVAQEISAQGKESIYLASDLLAAKKEKNPEEKPGG